MEPLRQQPQQLREEDCVSFVSASTASSPPRSAACIQEEQEENENISSRGSFSDDDDLCKAEGEAWIQQQMVQIQSRPQEQGQRGGRKRARKVETMPMKMVLDADEAREAIATLEGCNNSASSSGNRVGSLTLAVNNRRACRGCAGVLGRSGEVEGMLKRRKEEEEEEPESDSSMEEEDFTKYLLDIGGSQNRRQKVPRIVDTILELFSKFGGGTGACLRPVKVLDVRAVNVQQEYNESILNGIPVVLVGHRGLTGFADDWFTENRTFSTCSFTEACGDAKGPVCRRGYEGNQVTKENMSIADFVENHWTSKDDTMYLAQWQFPLNIFRSVGSFIRQDMASAQRKAKSQKQQLPNLDIAASSGEEQMSVEERPNSSLDTVAIPSSLKGRNRALLNPKWLDSTLPSCVGFDFLERSDGHAAVIKLEKPQKEAAVGATGTATPSPPPPPPSTVMEPDENKSSSEDLENSNEQLYKSLIERCARTNPYQYLFMGGPLTYTQLHNDPGGMTIIIAPIVGEKEVTMIHRDDLDLQYDIDCKYEIGEEPMDPNRFPGVLLGRSWRVVIRPGDLLVMPPRTFHAAQNLSNSLAYSRCHFGPNELLEIARSHHVKDAPEMAHDRALWNCAHSIIDEFWSCPSSAWVDPPPNSLPPTLPKSLDGARKQQLASPKLDALRAIRSFSKLFTTANSSTSSEEWTGLIRDIDNALEHVGGN